MKAFNFSHVFLLGIICLFIFGCDPLRGNERFDSLEWKKYSDCKSYSDTPRRLMVSDLTGRVLKQGMAQNRIKELLGDPDSMMKISSDITLLQYYIGYSGDNYFLRICIDDKTNQVVSFYACGS